MSFQNFNREKKRHFNFFTLFVAGGLAFFITIGFFAISYHTRLMEQCLSDGYKEYQCVRMLSIQEVSR